MCKDCENWKPKEIQCKNCVHSPRKGKICIKYVEGFSCFQQKTCGTCGWHNGIHLFISGLHYCELLKGYTPDKQKYDKDYGAGGVNCSWKPIEEPCPTCGGKGKIQINISDFPFMYYYEPCPTCREPKEEKICHWYKLSIVRCSYEKDRCCNLSDSWDKCLHGKLFKEDKQPKEEVLLMSVRWEIKSGVHCLVLGRKRIAEIYSDFGGHWRIGSCIGHDEDNFAHKYGELFIAKQAIEKALKITKK